jgi:hypothetical protein
MFALEDTIRSSILPIVSPALFLTVAPISFVACKLPAIGLRTVAPEGGAAGCGGLSVRCCAPTVPHSIAADVSVST